MTSVEYRDTENGPEAYFSYGDAAPLGLYAVAVEDSPVISDSNRSLVVREALRGIKLAARTINGTEEEEGMNSAFFQDELVFAPEEEKDQPFFKREIVKWIINAPYPELMQLCRWNVARHAKHQEAMDGITNDLKEDSIARAEQLRQVGLFSAHALRLYKQTVTDTGRIYALDSFESGGYGVRGLCNADLTIAMANPFANGYDFTTLMPYAYTTGFHEFFHRTGFAHNRGYAYSILTRLVHPDTYSLLAEEVAASHATRIAFNPGDNPDNLMPSDDESHSYKNEREFKAWLLHTGPKRVGAEQFIAGHMEKRNYPKVRREVETSMRINAQHFFPELGEAALFQIFRDYNNAKKPAAKDALLLRLIKRMNGMDDVDIVCEDELMSSLSISSVINFKDTENPSEQ
jgi:hypothetical protein